MAKKATRDGTESTRKVRKFRAQAGPTQKRSKRPSAPNVDNTPAWLPRYYLPDYSIQRAARDLMSHSTFQVIEDFAGRMFALQDMVNDEDLENISELEKESDSPFFLAIAAGVRKEARTGDPEYARSIAC